MLRSSASPPSVTTWLARLRPWAFIAILASLLTLNAFAQPTGKLSERGGERTGRDYSFSTIDVKNGLADNFVRDVTRDSYGYIWLSTINGLSRYDGYRFCNYMPQQYGAYSNDVIGVRETADSTLWMMAGGELFSYQRDEGTWLKDGATRLARLGIEGKMRTISVDEGGQLWVATQYGLYNYDYSTRQLMHYSHYGTPIVHIVSKGGTTVVVTADYHIYQVAAKERRLVPIAQAPDMTYNRDSRALLDSRGNLWLYHSHAFAGTQRVFSLTNRQWLPAEDWEGMDNVTMNVIAEDHSGRLWVGTDNQGVFIIDRNGSQQIGSTTMNIKAFKSQSGHISCLYLDNNNTMWVGSAKLGAAYADLCSPCFNVTLTDGHEDVSSLLQDHQGNLWIGFDGEGIMMKSPTGTTRYFSTLQQTLHSDIITSMTISKTGTVLAGAYGKGIATYNGTRFVTAYADNSDLRYVKAMCYDAQGNLWVATVDKGVIRVRTDGGFETYTSENAPLPSNGTLCLASDTLRSKIFVGTSTGLSIYDCRLGQFVTNQFTDDLKGQYVTALMVDDCHRLWIGTRNGLWVCRSTDETVTHLTTEQGLSHNVVRALVHSGRRIWASTDNGLTCIDIPEARDGNSHDDYQCRPFLDSDGLHDIVFSNNAALTTPGGTILLGCFTGYVSIMPGDIGSQHPRLHVAFTEFRINGSMVNKSDKGFSIKHDERLGISISIMVPSLSHKAKYLYRFKGEQEWMRAPSNMLYFASLAPGKHVLQVKAELPGQMSTEPSELPIRVLPPFWLSRAALLLYLLLLAGAVWIVYRGIRRKQLREVEMKQLEINLRKYEMEEEKISFFTNISHDIKTPLTLVVAPLEKIREHNLPDTIRTEIDVAWRNARQLYDLVLELLDFRRLDVGKEKLNLSHGDLVSFVRQTAQAFAYYTTRKQIDLMFKLPDTAVETLFDENKMRRIITNLLSNAYKYNNDGGSVTVSLDVHAKEAILSVADTGIGVKDKHHIFDRFVQETHGQEQEGSGLGLHIVRQYVEMMGGTINVTDNQPTGTIFTVTLPLTTSAIDRGAEEVPAANMVATPEIAIAPDTQAQKPTILVVEDNTDARLFLQRSLDEDYYVLTAANGKEGLRLLARNEQVNIVISDVMMPVMDGIQFVRHIKEDIRFSHIPVILLSAKSNEEDVVAGLQEGVADYITKPYSLAVLRLRISKILEWEQNVYHKVANGIEIEPSEMTVSSLDEELISHVIANIEAHIRETNYSVVQLSSAVGMTRGNLYKKLMAIVGKSPVEFIRIVRLKRGKSLLDQGKTNISEVADMVGISPKQFAHYFKHMYGDTPSDYLKKNRKK